MPPSPLFLPFRALGYITDDLPFSVQRRGRESYVTVSVGQAWQVYNCTKLSLALVGPQLEGGITALASKGDLTFAAVGSDILECRRVHRSGVYAGAHSKQVLQLLVLGGQLLSLGTDGLLCVWQTGVYSTPQAELYVGAGGFVPTCMAHPDTYLNKVVVGGEDGRLQLWNFSSGKLVYEFEQRPKPSAIRCIAPSPALDVVGLGLEDGRAVLLNLKLDKVVMVLANATGAGANAELYAMGETKPHAAGGGACTAISFSTGNGPPLVAAGGGAGVVTVWNLEERRMHTIIRDAHDAPLLSLHFFPGEPLLMSSAADNSVKQWLFDQADRAGRLLRFRSGHAAPPQRLQYYGDGTRLLSAGRDRAFRLFSVIQDQQSRELSQGHTARRAKRLRVAELDLKLAPVTDLAACQVRERDWCNVLTSHEGDTAAYTWLLKNFTIGDHVLRPPKREIAEGSALAPVTCVAVSSCGNYGLVGSAGGRVDRYNMQSGLHRGTYCRSEGMQASTSGRTAHDGAVTGLSVDSCNRVLASAGRDGQLRLWDFKARRPTACLAVGSPVTRLRHHAGTALLAVACDDLVIRMFDIAAVRLVRQFRGHGAPVTDLALSEDCRWLLSASEDGTTRIWDIPSARILQVMRLGGVVSALSLAPRMDMLATAHTGRRGISLWANQLIFGMGADVLPSEEPVEVALPTVSAGRGRAGAVDEHPSSSSDDDKTSNDEAEAMDTQQAAPSGTESAGGLGGAYSARDGAGAPAPLTPQLVTLSQLPRSQWQNLVHLDAIKQRSRPLQPPKKPAAAPFFLPTIAGLHSQPMFDIAAAERAEEDAATAGSRSRVVSEYRGGGGGVASEFVRLLRAGAEAGDYTSLVAHLRSLAAAAVDQQLRAMQVLGGGDEEEEQEGVADLELLLGFIETETAAHRNFEFLQAFLRLVLQVHGDTILERPQLQAAAARIEQRLAATWSRLDGLVQSVRCMVTYFGNLQA